MVQNNALLDCLTLVILNNPKLMKCYICQLEKVQLTAKQREVHPTTTSTLCPRGDDIHLMRGRNTANFQIKKPEY